MLLGTPTSQFGQTIFEVTLYFMQQLNMCIAWTVEFKDNFAVVNSLFRKWIGNSSAIALRGVIIYNTGKTAIHIHTGYIEVIMQGKCGRNTETTFDIK